MRTFYIRALPAFVVLLLLAAFLADLGDEVLWGD